GWLPNPLLPETKAEIALPIKLRNEVLGVLDVQADTVGGLSRSDEVLLLGLGGQIASAMQNTRLLAETQRRAQVATALYRTSEAVGRVGDLQATAHSLAKALVDILNYSSSWIAIVNETRDAIEGVAGYGFGMTEDSIKGSEPLREGYMNPTVLAVLQRQAVVVNDLSADPRAADVPDGVRVLASKLAELPIMIGDEVVGLLAVSRRADQEDITDQDVEVLQAVANQVTATMENARLLAETRSSLEQLQEAYEVQARLMETLREMSTPIVPVTREVLVLPLVGAVNAQRAEQVIESLLTGIEERRARVVIMDITGVPVVDANVANYLLRAALAARLLGAEVILVGITPQVAQAVVGLGVDLSEIVTRSDLQSGIAYALSLVGMKIGEEDTFSLEVRRE
ncbi:MAG: GAF domain-containing protein, partial [Chloroflexota bacterium]|nr:GAF domain-containing protein [Chloroflexota bacterium]